jgi:flagellar hook-length control protein FliK
LQDEEEEDKIFDSATLFAPQAAQQLPEKNLQTDQPVQGVLYNAEANPEAVAKIKSLLGDVLNLEVSPLQEVVVEMPAVIPSVGSVSEAIAQAATQPELPVGSPSSFTLTPPANENAVVEDIEIISRRAGQPHPLMTMAHEASNEEGLVIPSSPIKSQNTEKQPDSLPPVVNHSENQPFKTTLRQGRDAVKAVEEEVITSRFSVRSNDTSAESLADFASGAETQFSVREEGVIEAEDSITAIRENTVSQISARATKKITQAAERFALRQDNTVPAEQVLVRIRDLPRPGNHRIQIHLDPVELGKVDVTMDVAIDGRTQLTMTVDRKETLELLQRDRVSLEKSLNELGLKTDAGGMSFNLREQPKGQQQAAGDNQSQQNPQQPFRNQDVLPEELREDLTPLEPYRSYLLTLDESVNISV